MREYITESDYIYREQFDVEGEKNAGKNKCMDKCTKRKENIKIGFGKIKIYSVWKFWNKIEGKKKGKMSGEDRNEGSRERKRRGYKRRRK